MFTFADIISIAVQVEKNGEDAYRKTAHLVSDPQLREILLWMADEEKSHAAWFSQLATPGKQAEDQDELEQMGRNLLQDMVRGNSFLLDRQELMDASTVKEIVDRSKILEEDTIVFYQFLMGFLEHEDTVSQLKTIIDEEKAHSRKLENYSRENLTSASETYQESS